MPIPLEQGASKKRQQQIARLQRQQTGTTKDVRRLLYKARLHAIEADNGNEDAREDMLVHLDAAIERGMSPNAITRGGGMVNKINDLLDRPESQSHALGLLLNAADLLADFDATKAADVRTIADTLDNTQDHATWQSIATPVREVFRR
jgi:hypothetical protein